MCICDTPAQQLKQPCFQACFTPKGFQGLNEAQKCFLNDILGVGVLAESSSCESQKPSVKLRDECFPIRTVSVPDSVEKLLVKLVQRVVQGLAMREMETGPDSK